MSEEKLQNTVKDLESDIRLIDSKVESINDKIDEMRVVVEKQTQILEKFIVWQERHQQLSDRVDDLEDNVIERRRETDPFIQATREKITKFNTIVAAIAFVFTVSSTWIGWIVKRQIETIDHLEVAEIEYKTRLIQLETDTARLAIDLRRNNDEDTRAHTQFESFMGRNPRPIP